MKISLEGRNFELTEAISNRVEKMVEKALTKFAEDFVMVTVIMDFMKHRKGDQPSADVKIKVESSETPLQKNLDALGKTLAKGAFAIVLLISVLGYIRGEPLLDLFIFAIALAVAVVPEALPAVVTISLAIGVQRMVKRHALVRKLPAVETLGSTSVICSDKTGTLTRDEMTVRKLYVAGRVLSVSGSGYVPHGSFEENEKPVSPDAILMDCLRAGTLASDTRLQKTEDEWDIVGDPTEGAIVVAAAKAGLKKDLLDEEFPRIAEIPFTSESKRMTTLHKKGEDTFAFAKGAPEMLLPSCTHEKTADGVVPLTRERREELLGTAQMFAKDALRVLAIAEKHQASLETAENGLTLLGLVGMIDPPRDEAKSAVAKCQSAGIRVVMITGDHPVTAEAIARELGICKKGIVVTGPELEAMSDATLENDAETIEVYARVSPAHKLRVISALQAREHIVAMTGDGVNDAPALKKADIGIAMGITGTDVTKEAAAMTLTDDNFASIVAAVEEGRAIFGNVKKYLMYLLSSNTGEILLMTGASLMGFPAPLSAVQILYVNLATDGLPALALALDPPEPDLMARPPRKAQRSIFSRRVVTLLLAGGIWSMIVNLGIFLFMLSIGRTKDEAMTMTFVTLVLTEFFKAYNFRSDRLSVFTGTFKNKWLNMAIFWELCLLLVIIYVPFFHAAFHTYYLPLADWGIALVLGASVTVVLEVVKAILRRMPAQ
jgi:Ca2+-transporting ATPase